MTGKTHKSAVVIVPPKELWEPIQTIRRIHDRQVRRWMPHITLLYPFVPADRFDRITELLAQTCRESEPFEVTLSGFRHFEHRPGRYTLWLTPEPREPLVRLHEALWKVIPECDDVRRHPGGFTPHLSVGQAHGHGRLRELERSLQATWQPSSFTVTGIALIRRDDPPDDVFHIAHILPLGRTAAP